jgi:hypothetical protein
VSSDAIDVVIPTVDRDLQRGRRIATSNRGPYEGDPLGRVWLPVRDERRPSLLELPTDLGLPRSNRS